LEGGSKAIGYHVASFQLDLQLKILIANAHVIKWGKKKLTNEIAEFNGLIIFP
jgi:hypothetical protein